LPTAGPSKVETTEPCLEPNEEEATEACRWRGSNFLGLRSCDCSLMVAKRREEVDDDGAGC